MKRKKLICRGVQGLFANRKMGGEWWLDIRKKDGNSLAQLWWQQQFLWQIDYCPDIPEGYADRIHGNCRHGPSTALTPPCNIPMSDDLLKHCWEVEGANSHGNRKQVSHCPGKGHFAMQWMPGTMHVQHHKGWKKWRKSHKWLPIFPRQEAVTLWILFRSARLEGKLQQNPQIQRP